MNNISTSGSRWLYIFIWNLFKIKVQLANVTPVFSFNDTRVYLDIQHGTRVRKRERESRNTFLNFP